MKKYQYKLLRERIDCDITRILNDYGENGWHAASFNVANITSPGSFEEYYEVLLEREAPRDERTLLNENNAPK